LNDEVAFGATQVADLRQQGNEDVVNYFLEIKVIYFCHFGKILPLMKYDGGVSSFNKEICLV
jgi:hypothetical protein